MTAAECTVSLTDVSRPWRSRSRNSYRPSASCCCKQALTIHRARSYDA
jgi:hypothetical protein